MKQLKGYTLAELLVTVGIIGIITSILGVAATKLRPDQLKEKYLKRYDALNQVVHDAATNSKIYPISYKDSTGQPFNCQKYPLYNISKGLGKYNIYEGTNKICLIAADIMTGDLHGSKCNEPLTSAKDGNVMSPSFTTQNGTDWLFITEHSDSGSIKTYETQVYIDINQDALPNCLYSADSCTEPDRFKFLIAADGTVLPADSLGNAYLKTRTNMTKQSLTIEPVDETLPQDVREYRIIDTEPPKPQRIYY